MTKVIAALNKHLLTGTTLALSLLLGLLHLTSLSLEIQLKGLIYQPQKELEIPGIQDVRSKYKWTGRVA